MVRILHLNRLPKASRIRAIQFRRTTPGNFGRLISPTVEGYKPPLDPSHPWAGDHPNKYRRRLPRHTSPFLNVYAYPKALLGPYDSTHAEGPPFDPAPETPYGKDGKLAGGRKKVNMSLMQILSRKLHKRATIRNKVRNRLKHVVALIVTRDAAVEKINGKEQLVTTESNDGEKWILQNWTYVFVPTLEVYRMPLTKLIVGVRTALEDVNSKAHKIEYSWKLQSLAPPAKYSASSRPRPVNTLSRIRALFRPYAQVSAVIDDDFLIDDEESSSGLIKVQLPPRSSASDAASKRLNFRQVMFSKKPILKLAVQPEKKTRPR